MRIRKSCSFGLVLGLVVFVPHSFAAQMPAKPAPRPQAFPTPNFIHEKYDGVLSVNDHCPVRHGKLHPGIRPTYINRQPVGFC